jgi:transposase-like protein
MVNLPYQLMQIEAEVKCGANKGKNSQERLTYFSVARIRRLNTRLDTTYLYLPQLSQGGYIPFFLTQRKRSEAGLMASVREAFINGVSTRKMERLARPLGIESISAAQVSEINKALSQQVDFFRNRPL